MKVLHHDDVKTVTHWTTLLDSDDEMFMKHIMGDGNGRALLLALLAGGAHSTFTSLEREGKGPMSLHYQQFIETLDFLMQGGQVNAWEMFG